MIELNLRQSNLQKTNWQIKKNRIDMSYQQILQKYQVILATQYSIPGIIFGYALSKTLENMNLIFINIIWGLVLTIPIWFMTNILRQRIENELESIKTEVSKL